MKFLCFRPRSVFEEVCRVLLSRPPDSMLAFLGIGSVGADVEVFHAGGCSAFSGIGFSLSRTIG